MLAFQTYRRRPPARVPAMYEACTGGRIAVKARAGARAGALVHTRRVILSSSGWRNAAQPRYRAQRPSAFTWRDAGQSINIRAAAQYTRSRARLRSRETSHSSGAHITAHSRATHRVGGRSSRAHLEVLGQPRANVELARHGRTADVRGGYALSNERRGAVTTLRRPASRENAVAESSEVGDERPTHPQLRSIIHARR